MADLEVNRRLKKLIREIFKESTLSFSSKYNDNNGVKTSQVLRERNGLSSKLLESILEAYPQINRTWLLTGEGEPLKTGDINIGNVKNAGGNYGSINAGIVNNVNAYGYEKIIKPDGTLVLELAKPNSKNAVGAQEIVMEYNTLQAKIKLLEEKCAAKDETIQALKMTIDVLSSNANK